MGVMRYMTGDGDTAVKWDEKNDEDVAEVNRRFDEIVRTGYSAVAVSGGATKVIEGFDKTAEEIILMPNVVAG